MTLEELTDRMAIIDVCTRLHWYVDHREWNRLDSVLAERVCFPTPEEAAAADFDPAEIIGHRLPAPLRMRDPHLGEGALDCREILSGERECCSQPERGCALRAYVGELASPLHHCVGVFLYLFRKKRTPQPD